MSSGFWPLHRQGLSVRVIARELGASRSSVHRLVAAQAAAELAAAAALPQRASEPQQAAAIAAIAQVGQRLLAACGSREDADELTDILELFDGLMFDDDGGLSPLFCFRLRCGYDVPPELATVIRAQLAPFADCAELGACLDAAVARWEQLQAAVL